MLNGKNAQLQNMAGRWLGALALATLILGACAPKMPSVTKASLRAGLGAGATQSARKTLEDFASTASFEQIFKLGEAAQEGLRRLDPLRLSEPEITSEEERKPAVSESEIRESVALGLDGISESARQCLIQVAKDAISVEACEFRESDHGGLEILSLAAESMIR